MKIAIEGCAHGELERIYESIAHIEEREGMKVDLLICCGDFQSTRNLDDLQCMAVPEKFHDMCTFYKYYSGEKIAPILTIFIGGNHEASNYLQELAYGGWVAPNIYYLGYAGVVNVAGIRIGGISGIYKSHDYNKGHHELPPYNGNTKRSVYHIRNLEIFRLKQLTNRIDIFLSHDWPRGVYQHGDANQLLRHKPFFKDEIESNTLGSPPCEDLLYHLKPNYWFAAHLHTKFAALIPHESSDEDDGKKPDNTKFLALDKCLPHRRFLQILDVDHDADKDIAIEYDLEWLTILHLTNHLMSVKDTANYMPGKGSPQRWMFTPTKDELNLVYHKLGCDLKVPLNFTQTATPYSPQSPVKISRQPSAQVNAQTLALCNSLNIDDPIALLLMYNNKKISINGSLTSQFDSLSSCTDISGCTDISTFENSSLKYSKDEDVVMQNKINRVSLSLPTPKVTDSDLDSTALDEERSRTKSTFTSDVSGSEKKSESDLSISQSDIITTSAKKFKRRNQEMYASVSEDVC